jgi:hypothetical protein
MTEAMQRCVPVSTGTLSPDQRVNYQFGLVLGVDELEQEDLYFRTRDERATRTLHGYGTASGLRTSANRPLSAPDDVEVRVEPGIGADQFGRPLVIPTAQCAKVGAWLAAQEVAASADGDPSPLQAHLGPSGDLTLYVVAEYDTCPDALVPLPGNPCGTDDDVTAPSRLRDSWQLGFRWAPPPMAQWDGVRALADLLLPIELHDGSLLESDELVLAEHIRALVPGSPGPLTPLPVVPVLPRTGARAALDRLVIIWITEVRPTLAPDLIDPAGDPAGDPAILLSAITVVPAAPFVTTAPVITSFLPPDDEGRPYLAPTQLIQELVALGGGVATIITGSPIETPSAALPEVTLASLTEIGTAANRRLLLWNHLPAPLVLPGTVSITRNGGPPQQFGVVAGPVPGTFRLNPPAAALADGELLEARLDLSTIRVRDVAAAIEVPLDTWLADRGLDVLGRQGDQLAVHHTVLPSPPVIPPFPEIPALRQVQQLATAQPVRIDGEVPGIEVWFHLDQEPFVDDERISDLDPDALVVQAEIDGGATPVTIPFELISVQHNVWQLLLDREVWRGEAGFSPYLRLTLELGRINVDNLGGNLLDLAEANQIFWLDTKAGKFVVLWVRMEQVG